MNNKISGMVEEEILEIITASAGKRKKAVVGIGDDAAVIRPEPGREMLFTTDCMVEGVHFTPDMPLNAVAQKAVAANLSDIAAMGGDAEYFLLSLGLPPGMEKTALFEFAGGISKAAGLYNIELIGGNLTSSEKFFIDITMIGSVSAGKGVRRSTALHGDVICITGTPGDSAAGLYALQKGLTINDDLRYLVKRHYYPAPRLHEGKILAGYATSMIDVSDGLSIDLMRLCKASGAGADIDREKIPVSRQLVNSAEKWGIDPVRFALAGGEDYELLFTVSPDKIKHINGVVFTPIGTIVDMASSTITGEGFDHFRRQ